MSEKGEEKSNASDSDSDNPEDVINKEILDESEVKDDVSAEEKQKEKKLLEELGVADVSKKSMQYLTQRKEKKKPHGPAFI
jgi:hypothetical protein